MDLITPTSSSTFTVELMRIYGNLIRTMIARNHDSSNILRIATTILNVIEQLNNYLPLDEYHTMVIKTVCYKKLVQSLSRMGLLYAYFEETTFTIEGKKIIMEDTYTNTNVKDLMKSLYELYTTIIDHFEFMSLDNLNLCFRMINTIMNRNSDAINKKDPSLIDSHYTLINIIIHSIMIDVQKKRNEQTFLIQKL